MLKDFSVLQIVFESQGSSVRIVNRLRAGDQGFKSRSEHEIFSSKRPDWLWGSACCSMGTGVLCRGSSGQGVKVNSHLHLVPRLMSGALPLRPLYAFMAWRGTVSLLLYRVFIHSVRNCQKYLMFLKTVRCFYNCRDGMKA